MNQILSVEMPNKKENNKKASIKSVIIFFCIVLVMLGIAMVTIGIISKIRSDEKNGDKKIEMVTNKPKIEIVQDRSTLNMTVSSENNISKIIYKWNDGEETQINGNSEQSISLEINIPLGTNTLSVIATDENGVSQNFEKEYIGVEEYNATITLEQKTNTINIKCSSESIINYISYKFDNEEEKTAQINSKTGEVAINAISGEHTLNVKIVDINGREYEEEKKIYIPTISIVTDGENFIIEAEDSRGISTVSINLNDNQEEPKEVNEIKYEDTRKLVDGENKIIVVVTNNDGLSITKGVKYEKK